MVTFQEASCDQAERYVAAGRWDCALVLPEDFEERLAGRDLGAKGISTGRTPQAVRRRARTSATAAQNSR